MIRSSGEEQLVKWSTQRIELWGQLWGVRQLKSWSEELEPQRQEVSSMVTKGPPWQKFTMGWAEKFLSAKVRSLFRCDLEYVRLPDNLKGKVGQF